MIKTSVKKRIDWIDFGKGFTIFLVVLGHVLLGLYQSNRFEADNTWLWIGVETIYIFHIPVFFALSGYFFKPLNSWKSYWNFAVQKTLQLGVPYIFYNIIQFIMQQIGGDSVRDQASFSDLLMIYKQPLGVSWFLYVLWGIFLVYGFLSVLIKSKHVLFGVSILSLLIVSFFPNDLMIIQRVGLWGSIFLTGNLLRDQSFRVPKAWLLSLGAIILAYLGLWYRLDFAHRISYRLPGFWGVIFFISVLLGFICFQLVPRNMFYQYFVTYGKDSLVIYILHAPIVSITRILLLKLGIDATVIHLVLGLLAGWFGSIFALYVLKKIPYLDFVFYPWKYIRQK